MKRAAIAFLAMLLAAPAVAQVNPQNLPPSTLYGRMPPNAGPGQAIPFSVLATQLNGSLSVGTSIISSGTNGALLYNNAGVLGNLATIGSSYFANNSVTNSILSTAGAATIKGNPTAATANVTDFTIQGLTAKASPDPTNDFLLLYDATGLALKKVTPGSIAGVNTAGVATLNGLAGALSIGAGTGISVTPSGATVTVNANTGTSGHTLPFLDGNNTFSGDQLFKTGRPQYDVDAYGAVHDGTTDDTTAVQAAITAADATGGTVKFGPGTYCLKTGITVTGNVSSVVLEGSGLTSTVLSVCGQNVVLITLNGTSFVEHMELIGSNSFSANKATVLNTAGGFFFDLYIQGGAYCIDFGTGATDGYMAYVQCRYAYSNALVRVRGQAWMYRNKLDQIWPNAQPAYGTTINAWAATTAYSAGTVVSTQNWYIQVAAGGGGTSAGSQPTLLPYETNITDGTVTWRLVAPATAYYSLLYDTGALESKDIQSDHTGPFQYGIAYLNSFSGTAPKLNYEDQGVIGQTINGGILLLAGSEFSVSHTEFGSCVVTGCPGILAQTSFSDAHITDNKFFGNEGYAIQITTGSQYVITGNTINSTVVKAISISCPVTDFVISNNIMTTSNAGGTWQTTAGACDYYNIVNNIVHGVAGSDSGSGTHKTLTGNN